MKALGVKTGEPIWDAVKKTWKKFELSAISAGTKC